MSTIVLGDGALSGDEQIAENDPRIVHRCRNGRRILRAKDGLFYVLVPTPGKSTFSWTYSYRSLTRALFQARGSVRFIEGVPYYRHEVRYRLADGRKRRMYRWSVGDKYVYQEVALELASRFGIEGIQPGSVRIELI